LYIAQLRRQLSSGVFVPGSVYTIVALCDDWFRDESSVASFVFRSIFRDLISRGWDDPQGIPTSEFNRFIADVLPCLNDVLAILPGDPSGAIEKLVVAYHDSM
jgi:hypothetical protein